MNPWFRMYGDVINDPKVMRLPEASRWQWVAFLAVASKYNGKLPPIAEISFLLRMTDQRAAALIAELHRAGLLDKVDGGFAPHNWEGRQYISDSSTDRVKRFRDKKRNVSETAGNVSSDVSVTPPEQSRAETETETDSKAIALAAEASGDPRTELFRRGLQDLAAMTGKGPNACRSFVGKCLQAAGDDAVTVLGLIDEAKRNRVADPSSWIVARLKLRDAPSGRPMTAFQKSKQETRDILDDLQSFATRGGDGNAGNLRLLPGHTGERSEGLRSGLAANVDDLPAGDCEAVG